MLEAAVATTSSELAEAQGEGARAQGESARSRGSADLPMKQRIVASTAQEVSEQQLPALPRPSKSCQGALLQHRCGSTATLCRCRRSSTELKRSRSGHRRKLHVTLMLRSSADGDDCDGSPPMHLLTAISLSNG